MLDIHGGNDPGVQVRLACEPYAELDSVEFCSLIVRDCDVALSPGVGFGPGGEGYVRFALIENEKRIQQGIRNLKRGLTKLG